MIHLPGPRCKALCSILIALALLLPGVLPAAAQSRPAFRVYLTFEDGPTTAYTPQILDILAEYGAHATFFPNGTQIAGKEAILQRVIREGHALGNHLWTEPGLYSGAADAAVIESYQQTEAAIRAALGPDLLPIYEAQVKLYRQPGGGARPFPATEGIHVITYNWHVDSDDCGWGMDTDGPSFDAQALANVLAEPVSSGGPRWNVYDFGDGVVVAMHDINRITPRILPVVLAELQAAGATFLALPRPEDSLGTMPVSLGRPPEASMPLLASGGLPGTVLTATLRDYAWVREAPRQGAPLVIASLPPETAVNVTGRQGEWLQVAVDDQTGWMHRATLRVLGPIPALPAVE